MINIEKLRTFRLTVAESEIAQAESLLKEQGFEFKEEPFSKYARRLCHEPMPLGRSLAAIFGLIYIQDRSSMLPPLMLAPEKGDFVLDMCASPGSKTGFLAQLVGTNGFVLGNEPNRLRLATLRANLQNLNFLQVATCSHKGEKINLPQGSCKNILLDPPCSGWGTVEKNPQVMKLWKGDKIKTLIRLQRNLLKQAAHLLSVGGKLVYSTCTTNTLENEEQVKFAIEELGLKLIELPKVAGFEWQDTQENAKGSLLVDGEKSQAQGFYIACFTKDDCTLNEAENSFAKDKQTKEYEFFKLPFENESMHNLLEYNCLDLNLLPKGKLACFGNHLRFLPEASFNTLPAKFVWQGISLGKIMNDKLQLSTLLRNLMPKIPPQNAIHLDDIKDIMALLSGRSLSTDIKDSITGLYWRSLPLCLVRIKNKRIIWYGK